ncbi:MAG: SAM-dependent chlorinase/fluorinase [Candidatus Eremiobacteraeota bacterium]|nr:SAM-dependent chlorinase/fluorinase [Candidatus Eremiobacteraeota bacterium]
MMKSGTIALLTDFGNEDPYVGVMKGVIATISPGTHVIDITHKIGSQDVVRAAFILSKVFHYFPSGTIFTVIVDPGVGTSRGAIVAKTRDYYFIAPDNGILSLVLAGKEISEMVEINNPKYMLAPVSDTFHGRDVFSPAAAHISSGVPLHCLGPHIQEYKKIDFPKPHVGKHLIRGRVLFADHFGNLITNIEASLLKDRKIGLVRIGGYMVHQINRSYIESVPGELLAIIGSYDTLEISISHGSAKEYLGDISGMDVEVWFGAEGIDTGVLL